MCDQGSAIAGEPGHQRRPGVGVWLGQDDRVEHAVEDGVDEVVLAGDVGVQRRGLDPE